MLKSVLISSRCVLGSTTIHDPWKVLTHLFKLKFWNGLPLVLVSVYMFSDSLSLGLCYFSVCQWFSMFSVELRLLFQVPNSYSQLFPSWLKYLRHWKLSSNWTPDCWKQGASYICWVVMPYFTAWSNRLSVILGSSLSLICYVLETLIGSIFKIYSESNHFLPNSLLYLSWVITVSTWVTAGISSLASLICFCLPISCCEHTH